MGGVQECWEWQLGRSPTGYGKIKVAGQHLRAHRVAWKLVFGEIPDGIFVCHRCDNPPCCNPAHLFLGTPKDNMDDKWAKGRGRAAPKGALNGQNTQPHRRPRGERNGMAKLTDAEVVDLRAAHSEGVTRTELVKRYGISRSQVSRIVTGQRRQTSV